MMMKRKIATAVVAVVVSSAFGMSSAYAATPEYTQENARFCAKAHKNNLIREGDTGFCVRVLQQLINKSGNSARQVKVDGDYGPKTKVAVLDNERALGFKPDGIVGEGTFLALAEVAGETGGSLGRALGRVAPGIGNARSGLGDAPSNSGLGDAPRPAPSRTGLGDAPKPTPVKTGLGDAPA